MCSTSKWWPDRAAQRKVLLEANRGPLLLVDVSRAVTAGNTPARGDSWLGVRVRLKQSYAAVC